MPSTRHVAVLAAAAVWVGAGAVVVALGLAPLAAERLRWSRAVAATALLALGGGAALNVTDGWQGGVLRGLESPSHEYPADVARVEDVGTFLRTSTERIDDSTTRSRGHPPGFVVLLVGLDRAAARTGVGIDGVERAALAATAGAVLVGVASLRPSRSFVIANLVVLGLAVGPAAVAAANLSGTSKGEVERIRLPFAVWLLPAAALLVRSRLDGWRTRGWLGAQAAGALGSRAFLLTGW